MNYFYQTKQSVDVINEITPQDKNISIIEIYDSTKLIYKNNIYPKDSSYYNYFSWVNVVDANKTSFGYTKLQVMDISKKVLIVDAIAAIIDVFPPNVTDPQKVDGKVAGTVIESIPTSIQLKEEIVLINALDLVIPLKQSSSIVEPLPVIKAAALNIDVPPLEVSLKSGNDTYIVNSSSDLVIESLNEGTDTVKASISYSLGSNLENLTLTGTLAINGVGNDLNNVIIGNAANNTINGGAGNDTLDGGQGNNRVFGDKGDDVILGGQGYYNFYDGGIGIDTVDYSRNAGALAIKLSADRVWGSYSSGGAAYTAYAGNRTDWHRYDEFVGIENVIGSNNNDAIIGNASINRLEGGAGDDQLYGESGADVLIGGFGNDSLDGGTEADVMSGGQGDDTYFVDNLSDVVAEEVTQGSDTVKSSISYDLGANIENLTLTGTLAINGVGNDLNNVLIGNAANNTLNGGAGNDTLDGGQGNNRVFGDKGDDVILGGQGYYNVYDGGVGNDTVDYSRNAGALAIKLSADRVWGSYSSGGAAYTAYAGNRTDWHRYDEFVSIENVIGSNNNDSIIGNADINRLAGGAGDDQLYGEAGADILTAGLGNDILDGGSQADLMSGGQGDDTYFVDNLGDVVAEELTQGTDTVKASISYSLGSNLENLTLTGTLAINGVGNDLNNVIIGNAANNTINGGAGNDTLDGGQGNNRVFGDKGDDVILGGQGYYNVYDGGVGNDTVDYSRNAGALAIKLSADRVWGSYSSGGAAYTAYAGNRTDWHRYDEFVSIENVIGSNNNDSIIGNADINRLAGGAGDDQLYGEAGADILTAGLGNDILDGGSQADLMSGGQGDDTYFVDNLGDVVAEELTQGTDTVKASISYSLGSNLENLTLTGTLAINGVGNDLNNVIIGNAANNTINGGAGNDTLDGGLGSDLMSGGQGDDTYFVDSLGDVVAEELTQGTDTVKASISYSLGSNLENLTLTGIVAINGTGNDLDNIILGNSSSNLLDGLLGNDDIYGGYGDDTFIGHASSFNYFDGGDGSDTVDYSASSSAIGVKLTADSRFWGFYSTGGGAYTYNLDSYDESGKDEFISIENVIGSAYVDTIIGNADNNTLCGGLGNDALSGAAGADNFVFNSALDPLNVDWINDFKKSESDLVYLDHKIFTKLAGLTDLTDYFCKDANLTANSFLLYSAETGNLSYDSDGSGSASLQVFAIFKSGQFEIDASCFVVI